MRWELVPVKEIDYQAEFIRLVIQIGNELLEEDGRGIKLTLWMFTRLGTQKLAENDKHPRER